MKNKFYSVSRADKILYGFLFFGSWLGLSYLFNALLKNQWLSIILSLFIIGFSFYLKINKDGDRIY